MTSPATSHEAFVAPGVFAAGRLFEDVPVWKTAPFLERHRRRDRRRYRVGLANVEIPRPARRPVLLLKLAEGEVRAGAGDECGWSPAGAGRARQALLGGLGNGTEFVLRHLNGGARA